MRLSSSTSTRRASLRGQRLEQAVAAFTEALKERIRVRVPLDWAATQSNLGAVLATLGRRLVFDCHRWRV